MGRHSTVVGAATTVLVVLLGWWLTAGVAGRAAERDQEAALRADALVASDWLADDGVLLEDRADPPLATALALLAPAGGAATVRDGDGRVLASGGDAAPAAALAPSVAATVTAGEVHVGREGATLRTVVPVGRTDATTYLLDVVRPATDVGAVAVRRATAWIVVAVAVAVAAVVVLAGRARDRLLRTRAEGTTAVVRRADALLAEHGDLDRAKDAFLSAVSHAVRTPLQVIQGASTLLANRADDLSRDQLQRLAEGMVDGTRRLTDLLQDVIDLDRLVQGLGSARRRPVDVPELLDGVLAHHDDARVRVDTAEVEALVDPGQLGRIVDHLVHNALRHSPPDGVVTVRVEEDDDGLHLVVEDQGPGIPEHLRLRVFEPLFRIDGADADPGLGVGLSLVRRFAGLHGGRAWVLSLIHI